jgi:hypothetical protein
MGKAGTRGRVPLEALILAFSHSRAKTLVGTDALRSVLSGQYREIHHDGAFDLEPVWQLLAQQPGFDAAHVLPALCRFKGWEKEMGVAVRMPADMSEMGEFERAELAAQVHVPAHERSRVLRGAKVQPDDPEAAAVDLADEVSQVRPAPPRPDRPDTAPSVPPTAQTPRLRRLTAGQRRALEAVALILALTGFSAAGIQLQRGCQSQHWETLPTRFAGDIPITGASRQGPEVAGALHDERWLALPAAVRTTHMKQALEGLSREVQVFFVRDREGRVRATARWFGAQPRQIAVTLQ